MPLLDREPSVEPPDLLEEGYDRGAGLWWVARTLSRQEKAAARWCQRSAVPYYLPQYERRWRSSGKRRKAWLPLFPGYLFFVGSSETRYDLLCAGNLAQVLEVRDQDELLRDLRRIRVAELSTRPLEVLSDWFEAGRPIRIARGPLKGLEGVVSERLGKARLIIRVQFIGQAVAVELDPVDLDPV